MPCTGTRLLQGAGRLDCARPFLFALINFEQRPARLRAILRIHKKIEGLFGAIQKPGFQVILSELVLCVHQVILRKIGTCEQILVHPDCALDFASPAKQVTQREMQFDSFRIELDDLDECIDRLIRLFIQ